MEININLQQLNNTYVFSYQGHAILKIDASRVTEKQANEIYDYLVLFFGNGVNLGHLFQQLEKDIATETFKAVYDIFETAINLGVSAN